MKGECLVESVAGVLTDGTRPNSILIFIEHYACACVKKSMGMHRCILWRRYLIPPSLQVQILKRYIHGRTINFFEGKCTHHLKSKAMIRFLPV